jgi:hypothetical protein
MPLPNNIAELLDSVPDSRSRYAIRRVLDAIFPDVAMGLVATGTNLATAFLLQAKTNIFTTVPVGSGASLNPTFGMGTCRVVNPTLNDLLIYPPDSAQIGSGVSIGTQKGPPIGVQKGPLSLRLIRSHGCFFVRLIRAVSSSRPDHPQGVARSCGQAGPQAIGGAGAQRA